MVDFNEDGILDHGQFVRGFLGEMSEECKLVVRKAFSRLDPSKRGIGELNDIRKYYCPSKHPSVIKGTLALFELLILLSHVKEGRKDHDFLLFTSFFYRPLFLFIFSCYFLVLIIN